MRSLPVNVRNTLTVSMVLVALASFTVRVDARSALPPPSESGRAPSLTAIDQVFDLRGLRPKTRDLVLNTLRSYDFDWRLLRAELKKQGRAARIRIRVADTSAWGAVGLAWPAPIGMIEIGENVRDPWWFRGILMHEIAHMVDFYYLAPAGLHDQVAEIYGSDWDIVWHSFNDAFTQAFSSFSAEDREHPLAGGQIRRLRALLAGKGDIPVKRAAPVSFHDLEHGAFEVPRPKQHQQVMEVPLP